ncbi:hypothetical protein QBC45DRAFT_394896 [Copromyces sp. CBS 386.78]|nr:hypothetical protein QBC45DRAFT_394896 [Copromyces sp. CBS 386.78]
MAIPLDSPAYQAYFVAEKSRQAEEYAEEQRKRKEEQEEEERKKKKKEEEEERKRKRKKEEEEEVTNQVGLTQSGGLVVGEVERIGS